MKKFAVFFMGVALNISLFLLIRKWAGAYVDIINEQIASPFLRDMGGLIATLTASIGLLFLQMILIVSLLITQTIVMRGKT